MIIPAHVPSTGVPGAHEVAQRLGQPLALDAERHRRRLAAGDDEPVEARQVGRHAHLAHLGAEVAQDLAVRLEVALEREDPDERGAHQPRLARSWRSSSLRVSSEVIAWPRPSHARATRVGVLVVRGRLDDRGAAARGVLGLEDARADEHALRAELHHERRVGRRGDAARAEHHDRQPAGLARRRARGRAAPGAPSRRSRAPASSSVVQAADLAADAAQVADRLDDVAGAGLALGADHRRALADPPQRLAEVGRAAHERHLEAPLVDVVAPRRPA